MKVCVAVWFVFLVGSFVRLNEAIDPVTGAAMIGSIIEGGSKLADLIKKLDDMFIKPITDQVNKEIAKIDTAIEGLRDEEKQLVEDARLKLVKVRHDIQRTRMILTLLADETIYRSKSMLNILKVILNKSTLTEKQQKGIRLTVKKMKNLLERSKELLGNALIQYEQAALDLKIVQEKLRMFSERVTEFASGSSKRHTEDAAALRLKVYVAAMAGCVVPPMCPVVYAVAVGVVESSIKRWNNALKSLKEQCSNSARRADELVVKLDGDIKYMYTEEILIMKWASKISLMYDDYKYGDFVNDAIDEEAFNEGYSLNKINDLISACQAFKAHSANAHG